MHPWQGFFGLGNSQAVKIGRFLKTDLLARQPHPSKLLRTLKLVVEQRCNCNLFGRSRGERRSPAPRSASACRSGTAAPSRSAAPPSSPELKGSISEGPNHSNHSNHPNHSNHSNHSNSFKIIIGIFRNFSLENSKITEIFNIF